MPARRERVNIWHTGSEIKTPPVPMPRDMNVAFELGAVEELFNQRIALVSSLNATLEKCVGSCGSLLRTNTSDRQVSRGATKVSGGLLLEPPLAASGQARRSP